MKDANLNQHLYLQDGFEILRQLSSLLHLRVCSLYASSTNRNIFVEFFENENSALYNPSILA